MTADGPCNAVACACVALVGVIVAVYWRARGSSTKSSQMMLLADSSDSGHKDVQEMVDLMIDSHGVPIELGSGSYGKVTVQNQYHAGRHALLRVFYLPFSCSPFLFMSRCIRGGGEGCWWQ